MRMDYGLKLELQQKLVMTPQLRQAIAILQLSSLELAEMVEQQMLENPVLELEEKPSVEVPEEDAVDLQLKKYFDWAEYFNDGTDTGYSAPVADDKPSFTALAPATSTLQDHLEFQLHLAVLAGVARHIGGYLIGCIDDNGYLCGTVTEAAQNMGVSVQTVEDVLKLIQTFDPPGVGARDLRECLMIQVEYRAMNDRLVSAIVDKYLDEVAAGHYKLIADKLACTPHDVQRAVDLIRTLDPKPGRAFSSGDQPCYIIPDVTIERVSGNYVIIINDSNIPHLTINPYYRRIVRDADGEAKKFVEGRINAAVWLLKSIEQRRRTLYNVVATIIELQRDFFDYGSKFLHPLTMKKVADQVGIHESTVSRAIANKYAETPHGVVSLRTFFTAGLQGVDGASLSASTVKRLIKDMAGQEDPGHPLSDQAMAECLAGRGITVSRRTVAKYREELGIQSSAKRKRY
ncbi:MAG: RNA polymerase factor sigma-54 [Negativicutes bacterium]|nr:RNA polymerase factor sigma-54 [Negativicutes bacterium]MDR3591855.1 RNA polymerase factor sigma-54 [Negativicutes bacterium]